MTPLFYAFIPMDADQQVIATCSTGLEEFRMAGVEEVPRARDVDHSFIWLWRPQALGE